MTEDWQKYTVSQLKEELQRRDLPVSGKKADLISRLVDYGASKQQPSDQAAETARTAATSSPGKSKGAPAPDAKSGYASKPQSTEADRLALRRQRFGDAVLTEEERRKQRAERFNLVDPVKDEDLQKQRALRFGIETEEMKKDKLKERAKRFNLHDPALEEDKKKARLERFKQPVAASDKGTPATVSELQGLIKRRS